MKGSLLLSLPDGTMFLPALWGPTSLMCLRICIFTEYPTGMCHFGLWVVVNILLFQSSRPSWGEWSTSPFIWSSTPAIRSFFRNWRERRRTVTESPTTGDVIHCLLVYSHSTQHLFCTLTTLSNGLLQGSWRHLELRHWTSPERNRSLGSRDGCETEPNTSLWNRSNMIRFLSSSTSPSLFYVSSQRRELVLLRDA